MLCPRPDRAAGPEVTKAVLGRAEDEVGTVEIVSVDDASSKAVMKKQVLVPKAGDRARITPKKIALAVLPVRPDHPEIIQGLNERLGEIGRFSVLGADKVAAFLKDRKDRDAGLAKDLSKTYDLDATAAVSIYPTDGKSLVTARIFYADETKPLDTVVAVMNLSSKRDALGDIRPFFAPVPVKETAGPKTVDLPIDAHFFCVADLDGDGVAEYLFSNGKNLSVYRSDGSGWKELWTERPAKPELEMEQFHIDVADINGNGKPEIFVTRMLKGIVSSYVVELRDGAYARIADVPGFLRVLAVPGKGAVLIGQDYDAKKFYAGKPHEVAWSGGSYAAGPELAIPRETTLYSFVFADFGEGKLLAVSFDDDHRLVVSSGDTRLWRSEEKYLTVESVVTKPASGLDAALGRSADAEDVQRSIVGTSIAVDKSREVRVPGRMISVDMNGDGRDELVVAKNSRDILLGEYKGGEIEVLSWTGSRLEARWNVRDLAGPVRDLQVLRTEAGTSIKGLVLVSGGLFGKDHVRVETYDGK